MFSVLLRPPSPFAIARFWMPNAKALRVAIVRRLVNKPARVGIVATSGREDTRHGRIIGRVAGAHARRVREVGQGRGAGEARAFGEHV